MEADKRFRLMQINFTILHLYFKVAYLCRRSQSSTGSLLAKFGGLLVIGGSYSSIGSWLAKFGSLLACGRSEPWHWFFAD